MYIKKNEQGDIIGFCRYRMPVISETITEGYEGDQEQGWVSVAPEDEEALEQFLNED